MILFKFTKSVAKISVPVTVHEMLLLSSAFSCLLLFARMIVSGSMAHIFLPWNLFLAFVPYCISWWLTKNEKILQNKIKLALALGFWLLFIPNSFYIITDLFHLNRFPSAPVWFDLLMIFSFAWNGLLFGIVSLRRVELLLNKLRGKPFSILLVFVVMWLSAFGIYIGRFLRYNSWDIITDPFSLAGEIIEMIIYPFDNAYAWGMTLCYSVFMTLVYLTISKLSVAFSR